MPTTQSKENDAQLDKLSDERRKRVVRAINWSIFQSVCQHVITLQSEPMLVREICQGNVARSAQMLANTQGLVGLLGLFVNQAGGKFSDALGRKPGLLLGPICNIIIGQLVFNNPGNSLLVLVCRVIRMAATTFSNTVICSAAFADLLQGEQLAMAMSTTGAITGLAIILTPFFETLILQRTKNPRYTYLALSIMASVQLLINILYTPETLPAAKKVAVESVMKLRTFNPFGFVEIFRSGSQALQKMVSINTLQMFLEGKNLSDIVEIWKREHLKWSITGSRNFVMVYGTLCVVSGVSITPLFLKNLSARGFTTATNLMNLAGFLIRGAAELPWLFMFSVIFMLPGVNGTSSYAIKAICADRASKEKFGRGEFSAWVNNLRAIAGSLAPVLYGNYYAWARRRGVSPGTVFWLAALVGAVLPEAILWGTTDAELRRELPAPASSGAKQGDAAPAEKATK